MKAATCHAFGLLTQWGIVIEEQKGLLLNQHIQRENKDRLKGRQDLFPKLLSSLTCFYLLRLTAVDQ